MSADAGQGSAALFIRRRKTPYMHFPTTHWSLLARATRHGDGESRTALEELCRRYWEPVHQFIRSRGVPDPEAEDVTQDFMLHVVEKSAFGRADRLRGRFRSFLLGVLVRFLGDRADHRNALKRGGTIHHVSLDSAQLADDGAEPSVPSDKATLFDREWALTILENALRKVREEYSTSQRESVFAVLKQFLPGDAQPPSYDTAASQLGLSVSALKSEIHRLRRRFRALVREEIAQTVSAPHEIDGEMAHLQEMLIDRGSEFGRSHET